MLCRSVVSSCFGRGPELCAPGRLGELTRVIDPQLVDVVLAETGARERRVRLLPARVVVYFVLVLALFERSSCQAVWGRLGVGLRGVALTSPAASWLSRARRRPGGVPLRRLCLTYRRLLATAAQPPAHLRQVAYEACDTRA